ncbi:MAG TPA: hypothetical protein DDX59_06555 [Lachnospiraceae bacterium]|nr:hypothetical protein [Lachnospiraceae bacterium]
MNTMILVKGFDTSMLTAKDILKNAVRSMAECVSYMHAGDDRMAHLFHGKAMVWEDLYNQLTNEWPEDVNKRYEKMLDEYCEHYLESKR